MKEERLEFIVLTWNGLEDTKKCVSSIISYHNKPRIIIVDNGSTDDTLEWVEDFKKHYKFMTLIKVRCGFSQAVNTGLRSCESKYPIVCNNDIILTNSLRILSESLKINQRYKIMASTTNVCGQPLQWFPHHSCVKPCIIKSNDINMVCFSINRSYWKRNKLDANYKSGVEDIAYCWSIRLKNFYVGICLGAFVYHKGEETNKREYKKEGMKKNLVFGWKYFAKKFKEYGGLKRANEYFKYKDERDILK